MNTQSGNALWFILIAIVLLGLLTITLSRSGNNNETGRYEQNQIAASEILRYAKSIENAVQSLLARGCSENEISFENSVIAGYTNANAPADNSCHVFDPAGTGMIYTVPNDRWLDNSKSALYGYNTNLFTGKMFITNIGNDCSNQYCNELLLTIPFLREEMCNTINQVLNINSSFTAELIDSFGPDSDDLFTGSFDYLAGAALGDEDSSFAGKQSGCVYRSFNTHYMFYHTLHAR